MEQAMLCDYLQDTEVCTCMETGGVFVQPAHTLSWELLK